MPKSSTLCFKLLVLVELIAGVLTLSSAMAQTVDKKYEWVNQELLDRRLPQEQYVSVGRGDFAECRSEATRKANQAARIPDCSRAPLYQANDCLDEQDRARQLLTQMSSDSFVACMTRRGWVWTKLR